MAVATVILIVIVIVIVDRRGNRNKKWANSHGWPS
jgi:hypothetical protein